MPDIRVTTSADLKGFRDLQNEMGKLIAQAREFSSLMKQVSAPSGVAATAQGASTPHVYSEGAPHPPMAHPVRPALEGVARQTAPSVGSRQQRTVRPLSQTGSPNLFTSEGYTQYYENVVMPAMTTLGNVSRSGMSNIAGIRYQGRPMNVQTVKTTANDQMNWFQNIGKNLQALDEDTRSAWVQAAFASGNSTETFPSPIRSFVSQYGEQLGAPSVGTQKITTPIAQSFGQRLAQHFANNMGSGGIGKVLLGGLKGAAGGTIIDMLAGGGAEGAALGGMGAAGIGGALGGVGGGIVAALGTTLISGIANQLKQGYSNWTSTAPDISALAHSLGQASSDVEQFRVNVQMAGANVGMTLQQSAQAAVMLTQSFSGLSENGIANLVQQTGSAALYNGLPSQQMAQIVSLSANYGITNGKAAVMNTGQFNAMLENMTAQSGMQGRQAPLYTGLMSIYGTLAGTNPTIGNPNGVAAQYTAMNATGIQGLQGMRGAQLVSQMDQGFASAQGVQQAIAMTAIMQASGGKITNPFQMMSMMEQGSAAKVGNTTLLGAYSNVVNKLAGGNKYLAAAMFPGLDINQALAMNHSSITNAKSISEKNAGITTLSNVDRVNITADVISVESSRAGYLATQAKEMAAGTLANTPYAVDANGNPYVGSGGATGNGNSYFVRSKVSPQLSQNSGNVLNQISSFFMSGFGSPGENNPKNIMQGIMQVESTGHLYTINDNSTGGPNGTPYYFNSYKAYLQKANQLLAKGHQLALGPYQLESFHKGVTPQDAVNLKWASSYALNDILLPNYKKTGSWDQAIADYGGGTQTYLSEVRSAEAGIASGTTTLTTATINAIGQAVANALKQHGITNPSARGPKGG